MTERQEQLLKILIEEYISSAKSVASGFLSHKLEGQVSSATIRNELAALEEMGYLIQPHTSSGRVPTAKAYQFYVDKFVGESLLAVDLQEDIIKSLELAKEKRQALKNLAKKLAEVSGEAIILAFEKNDIYYTGLSNLFAKPEFEEKQMVLDVSRVIDHLDAVILSIFDQTGATQIKIGDNCQFSKYCSVVFGRHKNFLIAVLGPLRMDYQKNYDLVNFILNIK